MVEFIAIHNKSAFEKIHNHATWAVTGVGMISYVMGDKDMLEKALYGLDKSGKSGFIRQIDQLFSPDGYFEEGPYYQRYSLQPFIMFAQAIENNEPERKIFEYKNGVILKAVTTLLQMSENNGQFFHFNVLLVPHFSVQNMSDCRQSPSLHYPWDNHKKEQGKQNEVKTVHLRIPPNLYSGDSISCFGISHCFFTVHRFIYSPNKAYSI